MKNQEEKLMKIDLTLKITPRMVTDAQGNEKKTLVGHLGTHFDVMNKEFPLEYTERKGIVFDVRNIRNRDIDTTDIDLDEVSENMFVAFCTGFIEDEGYGTPRYFSEHPQLSNELLEALLNKGISIIGIDFAGVRRGKEHTTMDQHCADHGIFIIENLCNLDKLLIADHTFKANTYPVNYAGMTGLPCRVIADI
jgi:kynurenine formamidase